MTESDLLDSINRVPTSSILLSHICLLDGTWAAILARLQDPAGHQVDINLDWLSQGSRTVFFDGTRQCSDIKTFWGLGIDAFAAKEADGADQPISYGLKDLSEVDDGWIKRSISTNIKLHGPPGKFLLPEREMATSSETGGSIATEDLRRLLFPLADKSRRVSAISGYTLKLMTPRFTASKARADKS